MYPHNYHRSINVYIPPMTSAAEAASPGRIFSGQVEIDGEKNNIAVGASSYLSLVQDKNPVVVSHSVDPVRNGEDCAICKRLPDRVLDHGIRLHINRCSSFVKK